MGEVIAVSRERLCGAREWTAALSVCFTKPGGGGLLAVMRPAATACFALFLLLYCSGCATKSPLACPEQREPRISKVYFASDRRLLPASDLSFGRRRSDPPELRFGWEQVQLGPEHRIGKVDKAVQITPRSQVTEIEVSGPGGPLMKSNRRIETFVRNQLRAAVRNAPPPRPGAKRQVLIFIHGYNTTFDYAVRKTAQLAADLEMVTCDGAPRGVPIAYSWPAQGTVLSYFADEENAEWTEQRLAPFLMEVAQLCRRENAELQVIGHSLGARALIRALADLALMRKQSTHNRELFDQVALLAPDIGSGLFEQYAERVLPLVGHMTIYVSASDRALGISRFLHGGSGRLGLLESSLRALLDLVDFTDFDEEMDPAQEYLGGDILGTKLDVIDVTGGLAEGLGHIYADPEFINDLKELIYNNTPAGTGGRSNLRRKEVGERLLRGPAAEDLQYFELIRE